MAVEQDSVSSGSTTGTTLSITHTPSGTARSDRGLCVVLTWGSTSSQTITSVKINDTTDLVSLGSVRNTGGGDNPSSEVFGYAIEADIPDYDGGTFTIDIVLSASPDESCDVGVLALYNVNQDATPSNTFLNFNSAVSDDGTMTVTITTTTGELVCGGGGSRRALTSTVGSEQWNINAALDQAGATNTGSSSATITWTTGGGGPPHWAIVGVSVKTVVAGGSIAPLAAHHMKQMAGT